MATDGTEETLIGRGGRYYGTVYVSASSLNETDSDLYERKIQSSAVEYSNEKESVLCRSRSFNGKSLYSSLENWTANLMRLLPSPVLYYATSHVIQPTDHRFDPNVRIPASPLSLLATQTDFRPRRLPPTAVLSLDTLAFSAIWILEGMIQMGKGSIVIRGESWFRRISCCVVLSLPRLGPSVEQQSLSLLSVCSLAAS